MAEWEVCLRLVLSCVMGGIIGYERQMRNKSAGLRTNMLVALGSCLIMIMSQALYDNVEGKTNADPARLAAQVVSGIGFLGAGAIMKGISHGSMRGSIMNACSPSPSTRLTVPGRSCASVPALRISICAHAG